MQNLTQAFLHSVLDYDPETGLLTWKHRDRSHFASAREHARWNTRYAGQLAFQAAYSKGYLGGKLAGRKYPAHRICWLHFHGKHPKTCIDHKNQNKHDNRITNLRDASYSQNAKNRKKSKANTSGCVGVSLNKKTGRWLAFVSSEGKRTYLGSFLDKENAINARKEAERNHGFLSTHGS